MAHAGELFLRRAGLARKGGRSLEVPTPSCRTNESRGRAQQHPNPLYSGRGSPTDRGDHSVQRVNVESLCCAPETHALLCVDST